MTAEGMVTVMERTLITALEIGGPIVIGGMVVGLIVSIFQAATQINEATLTFVPKLLVVAAILIVLGPMMIQSMVDLFRFVLSVGVMTTPVNGG